MKYYLKTENNYLKTQTQKKQKLHFPRTQQWLF